jgi:SNF2 family DNA or RNA helicase
VALAVNRLKKDDTSRSGPTLVVCPASVTRHWCSEIGKFFSSSFFQPVLFTELQQSSQNSSSVVVEEDESMFANVTAMDIIIVSYSKLQRNAVHFRPILWETIILDEAHMVKNPKSLMAEAVFSLQGKHRMALSGTPLQNNVQELWSIFNFLLPDYLGAYADFRTEYVLPIEKSFELRKTGSNGRTAHQVSISVEGISKLRVLHKQVLCVHDY